MTELKKAIGLRLPSTIWENIKQYGLEHFPGEKSREGFDVTQTVVTLLAQALGTCLDGQTVHQSNRLTDERITVVVKQQLDARITMFEQQLNERLTGIEREVAGLKKIALTDDDLVKSTNSIATTPNPENASPRIPDIHPTAYEVNSTDSIATTPNPENILAETLPISPTHKAETKSWKQFCQLIDEPLLKDRERNRSNADEAIELAAQKGFNGWEYDSKIKNFSKQ
jgi:hypothetical protein